MNETNIVIQMKTMKIWRNVFMMLAAFSLASCGSDEPRYADPEAHEKTVLLNEQYGPLMVGTWHYEKRMMERSRAIASGSNVSWSLLTVRSNTQTGKM